MSGARIFGFDPRNSQVIKSTGILGCVHLDLIKSLSSGIACLIISE
jgi:hypothetical protein